MRLYGNWGLLGILGVASVLVITVVFSLCRVQLVLRGKRATPQDHSDQCLQKYGGIELNYTKGSSSAFQFDLCNVISCGGNDVSWRGWDVYVCGLGWPGNQQWCPTWDHVLRATNRDFRPKTRTDSGVMKTAGYLAVQRDFSTSSNPITFSITNLTQTPYPSMPSGGCWDTDGRQFYLILGVDVTGKDPMALIKVNLLDAPTQPAHHR